MKRFNLEDRFVSFSVEIINISEQLPNTYAGKYLSEQILRSGVSSSLNYGEAQGGESRKDFVHKLKISLKELRETLISLKIIERTLYIKDYEKMNHALDETNQLISIIVKSIETAKDNDVKNVPFRNK